MALAAVIAAATTAGGAIGSAWIGARSNVKKDQQAEIIRQEVQKALRSTEGAHRQGRLDGLEEAQQKAKEANQGAPMQRAPDKIKP